MMGFLYIVERIIQNHLAMVDYRYIIGDAFDLIEQVGRKEYRSALIGYGADDRGKDVATDNGIKAGGRFVEQEQVRAVGQGD